MSERRGRVMAEHRRKQKERWAMEREERDAIRPKRESEYGTPSTGLAL